MRLAFVSVEDANDVHTWSGTTRYMVRGLMDAGADVEVVGPLRRPGRNLLKLAGKAYARVASTEYDCDREPYLLRSYARQIERRLTRLRPFDAVVSPGSIPVSLLEIPEPVVVWTDATYGSMIGFYDRYTNLSPRTIRIAREMEAAALRHATLFVASSEWARSSALIDYGIDRRRTDVISFGANLSEAPTARQSDPAKRLVSGEPIHILIVGTDWARKGVDIAVQTVSSLRARGIDACLDIVGCTPPQSYRLPRWAKAHGYIDKTDSMGRRRIAEMYEQAALFLLPSEAECTAIVLCEAAAYGLPSIVPRIGGMDSLVVDGKTGIVLDSPEVQDYAGSIQALLEDPRRYAAMSHQSRAEFCKRLNWDSATAHLLDSIRQAIADRQ